MLLSLGMNFPLNVIHDFGRHYTYVLVPLLAPATITHSKDTPTLLHESYGYGNKLHSFLERTQVTQMSNPQYEVFPTH